MRNITNAILKVVAIAMALFHCYTAYAGTYHPLVQRSIHVTFASVLGFLVFRATKKNSGGGIPLYDWFLAFLAVPVFGYITINEPYLSSRYPMTALYPLSPLEILFAVLAIVLLFELTRRLIGLPLVIVAAAMLAYCYLGPYIPFSLLRHRGFTIVEILDFMYLTQQGIWGIASGVCSTYLAIFVIFGAFITVGGAGEFFIEFAVSLTGHTRGGPAKVAIFSSALVGSVTGASMANVYTTGIFTIPMMKRLGYKPAFAGAVEALASNGGQIMPPVMGATAFLIAAFTGTSYANVILAALSSAIIYFGALFVYIHFEAVKLGLVGLSLEEKPSVRKVLYKGGYQLLPVAALIFLLFSGLSALRAGFFAILISILVSWVRKETRMGVKEISEALAEGAKNLIMMSATCHTVGFVVGGFLLTGLGLTFSSAIISLSGGIFFFSLFFTGMACVLLGMGMNSPAVYILVSVIAAPILITQEVNILPAHLFVFFCAILSHITPPVCLAIFAAAQLAGSHIWETAFTAMKTGFVAYLIPFLVIYNPAITLTGTLTEIIIAITSVSLGALLLVCGMQAWAIYRENTVERVLSFLGGISLILPGMMPKILGAFLVLVILALQIVRNKILKPKLSDRILPTHFFL